MSKRRFPPDHEGEWFAGKVVLVTGASGGLGRGIAVAFAGAGAELILVDIDEAGLSETADRLGRMGAKCLTRVVDVSNRAGMEALADEVLSRYAGVDVLVNNAGVGVGGELKDIPLDDMEWIVGINLMGEIYGTRLFLPRMIERGNGHIVNISSLSGLVLLPFHIAYTTTKFGITGFSYALWAEARRYGIGVTLVCPGAIRTGILERTRGHFAPGGQEKTLERFSSLLERRGMDPEEAGRRVVEAVAKNRFLLLTGFESYLLYYFWRLFPGLMLRVVAKITGAASR